MKTAKPPTTLHVNFAECSRFLEALKVNLGEVFRQFSIDYKRYEQQPYIFNNEKMGAIVQTIYNQVNLTDLGLLIGKRVRFGFDSLDDMPLDRQLNLNECLWALSRCPTDLFPEAIIEYFERSDVVGYKLICCSYSVPHQRFYIEALAATLCNFVRFLKGSKEVDYFRRDLAFEYLLSRDLDITSIALILGFSDSSAFSKAFRKWSGIPPREFKKQYGVKNFL